MRRLIAMGDWVAVAIASDVRSCVGGWKEVVVRVE